MESTVERAETMIDAASDVHLMIAYRMQTDPVVRRMRRLIRDGFVGDLVHVHGHMSQPLLDIIDDPDQWRLNPELAGVGASITDLGVYPLNTTRFVLDSEPVSVQADTWSGHPAFDKVPDERATFNVRFEGDVLATFTASQNACESGFLRVTGTTGEIELEPAFLGPSSMALSKGDASAEFDTPTVDQYHQMREEFDYFADCVLSDREPPADGEHGLVDMRVIEAAVESAERGERISLQ